MDFKRVLGRAPIEHTLFISMSTLTVTVMPCICYAGLGREGDGWLCKRLDSSSLRAPLITHSA